MLIFDVRPKIWDFFNVRTQKWVRPKCHGNTILVLFNYINLVKVFKKSSKFSKTAPPSPFRALRARKSENPAIEPPPSALNPAIERPPQGVRDSIISSTWTSKRARTGSYYVAVYHWYIPFSMVYTIATMVYGIYHLIQGSYWGSPAKSKWALLA